MRRALVTGGNRGIGLAIAKGLAHGGVEVVIGAKNYKDGQNAANQIGCEAVELDVASSSSIKQAVRNAGPIDVLINNAGILGTGNLLNDPQEFEESMAVMVHGPYLLMHHLTPHMVSQGYGRVVNISSGWGTFSDGVSGPASYGVAKAALNALTVASARTMSSCIKINAMCPGWVRTRMGGGSADRSPEQGAETAIWLGTLSDTGPTGKFFRDKKEIPW